MIWNLDVDQFCHVQDMCLAQENLQLLRVQLGSANEELEKLNNEQKQLDYFTSHTRDLFELAVQYVAGQIRRCADQ